MRLGAQFITLSPFEKESEEEKFPLRFKLQWVCRVNITPKKGNAARIAPGGRLPPTICDRATHPSPSAASVSSSLKWGQESYPSQESPENRIQMLWNRAWHVTSVSQVLAIHPQALWKMLHELAALGRGLEDWVTESKGDYVNFRLTKNLSGNLSAESSWCGWMADEGVVG